MTGCSFSPGAKCQVFEGLDRAFVDCAILHNITWLGRVCFTFVSKTIALEVSNNTNYIYFYDLALTRGQKVDFLPRAPYFFSSSFLPQASLFMISCIFLCQFLSHFDDDKMNIFGDFQRLEKF